MKSLFRYITSLVLLLILVAIPLGIANVDGKFNIDLAAIFHNISSFIKGFFTGDSFYYQQGDRTRLIFNDLISFFISSYLYLTISAIIVVFLSMLLGIFFWKRSSKWIDVSIGFIGVIPDFLLVLILQLLVVYINKSIGVKTVKVASSSISDPALFLPLFTLVLVPFIYLVKSLSEVTFEITTENYILTAKSKGLKKRYIYIYYITSNVIPYLKADLHKVISIMMANLFVVEYLYNTRGLTTILFQYQVHFGYQYNLVIMCLISFFILYLAFYFSLLLLIVSIERCISK